MNAPTGQLVVAAERRQRILDFLAIHPGARMDRIGAWLRAFGDEGNIHNTIRTMSEWGEIRFEGAARTRQYYALQQHTRSAEESRAQRTRNIAEANEQRQRAKLVESLKVRGQVHHPGAHPIKDQGGQGAIRPRVSIDCAQLW